MDALCNVSRVRCKLLRQQMKMTTFLKLCSQTLCKFSILKKGSILGVFLFFFLNDFLFENLISERSFATSFFFIATPSRKLYRVYRWAYNVSFDSTWANSKIFETFQCCLLYSKCIYIYIYIECFWRTYCRDTCRCHRDSSIQNLCGLVPSAIYDKSYAGYFWLIIK